MQKVSIYALVNPIDSSPFYIGATITKLKNRLDAHCCPSYDLGNGVMNERHNLIRSILDRGLKPRIKLLEEVMLEEADKREQYYYDYYTSLGFTMLQSSYSFQYSSNAKVRVVNRYIMKSRYS